MTPILIVDDRPSNRQLLISILGYFGCELFEAGDGAEALSIVKEKQPSLVITDVLMPKMDGFEFLRRLRADPAIAHTPVVFYTAEYLSRDDHALARAGGVTHHLSKPAEPEEILRVVNEILGAESTPVIIPQVEEFESDHRRLLTDKLAAQVNKLEAANLRQAAVADLGLLALGADASFDLMHKVVSVSARTLDAEYALVWELLPDSASLSMRAGVGWTHATPDHASLRIDANSQAAFALNSREPVIVDDFHTESRFIGSPLLREHSVTSGLTVVIPGKCRPFGILGVYTADRRLFIRDEGDFLQAVANVLAADIDRRQAEKSLRLSEEQLRLAVTGAGLGTWHWDLRSNQIAPSDACLAIHGVALHETLTLDGFFADVVHPDDRAGVQFALEHAIADKSEYVHEYRVPWFDGTYHWIAGRGCAYYDAAGNPLRMEGIVLDITASKQAEVALEAQAEQIRQMSRRLLGAQETERRHLARELHDETGQGLMALKINLQGALKHPAAPSSIERLQESLEVVDRTIAQIRNLLRDLRPSLLDDLGLVVALDTYCQGLAKRLGVSVTFVADSGLPRLNFDIETVCYRIAQEALNNVTKHAQATSVHVKLEKRDDILTIEITDDGVGFGIEAARGRGRGGASLGIVGMRERTELVGGSLSIQSAVGAGTVVKATLPFELR